MKRIIFLLIFTIVAFTAFSQEETKTTYTEQTLWNQIETKFLKGDIYDPIRYKSNILIQLKGNPTPQDSAIFKDLIVQLNNVIEKWDVDLVSKSGNLIFELNMIGNEGVINGMDRRTGVEIIETTVRLNISSDTTEEDRKKILYYHLMRSLVVMKNQPGASMSVPGCVFDAHSPNAITYHPIDMELIKTVYSENFTQQLKKKESYLIFLTKKYNKEIKVILSLLGFLLAAAFLFFMLNSLKKSRNNYFTFLKQGAIVFTTFIIFNLITSSISFLRFSPNIFGIGSISITLFVFLIVWFTITSLIFIIEKAFIRPNSSLFIKVTIPLFTTAIIPSLFLLFFGVIGKKASFPYVLIFSFVILFFSFFIGMLRALYIFLEIKSQNVISQKDLELARLNELNKQAELQSLQSKINPHFLYNSLNSIAGLARTDARKTEQMALALSDFFKYSLNKEQKETVSLTEEIHSVETYLEIEKVRFGERLNYTVNCPDELKQIPIPQFLIQPLIENAIKHGLSKVTGTGELRLEISEKDQKLEIAVSDNGPAFPDEPVSGYGLQSIQEKLKLIYGETAYLSWQNSPEKKITIRLPLQQKKKA